MRGGSRRLTALCVGSLWVFAAFGLAGCGGGSEPVTTTGTSVAKAISELQHAFAEDDIEAICKLTTRPAQIEVGKTAHKQPTTCVRDMARLIGMIEDSGGWEGSEPPALASETGDGDRRVATVRKGAWRADLPFAREDGKWKLAAFVGITRPALRRTERQMTRLPFPPSTGQRVTATAPDGKPCPPLKMKRDLRAQPTAVAYHPHAAGGCVIRVTGERAPVRMLTVFGDFKFDECEIDYVVRVGPDGATWSDKWRADGPDGGGCADLDPCISDASSSIYLPWKGRLERAGPDAFTQRTAMCMRTCVGFFVGEWVTKFERSGDGWRIGPANEGATGFVIDASLETEHDELVLRRGSRERP